MEQIYADTFTKKGTRTIQFNYLMNRDSTNNDFDMEKENRPRKIIGPENSGHGKFRNDISEFI